MKPVLSALGIINALGSDGASVLANWQAGTAPGLQQQTIGATHQRTWVGRVNDELPSIPKHLSAFACRNNQLLLAALAQISDTISHAIAQYGVTRIGVVIGSSTSGIAEGEQALAERLATQQWPEHYHYRQQEIGTPALFIAQYLELKGMAFTVSTACSSSAKALGSARRLLEMDICDAVICGGSDSLCQLTLQGFSALESVSAECCEPFAEHRNGITIGEGAALFLMEKNSNTAQKILFSGIGEASDAHHISAPHPEGIGAETAMRAALDDAKVSANAVSYINLHGTATPLNDSMESAAVHRLFGNSVPCSSTKSLTGHTLGAAGATEAGLCWLLLSPLNQTRSIPTQINAQPPDSTLAPIAIVRHTQTLPIQKNILALSHSFAFGGSNAVIALETSNE